MSEEEERKVSQDLGQALQLEIVLGGKHLQQNVQNVVLGEELALSFRLLRVAAVHLVHGQLQAIQRHLERRTASAPLRPHRVRVHLRSIESTLDVLHSKVLESVAAAFAASEWTRPDPAAARDGG